jgi:hypothetical protein
MCSHAETNDAEMLERENRDSIERARGLADEMKIVQQHESTILEDGEPSS